MPAEQIQHLILSYWMTLLAFAEDNVAVTLWHRIQQAYTQPHRRYHTLEHLASLLLLYEQYEGEIKKKKEVLFAIFYHDFVYEPGQSDNEEKSAQEAGAVLHGFNFGEEFITAVQAFILATKDHLSVHASDDDLNLFLDFDLAILGAPREVYHQYRKNIRLEYNIYTDEAFQSGRCAFLRNCLRASRIFKTKALQHRETAARQNLQEEAALLSC